MSQLLKVLLEPRIKRVLAGFGESEYIGPDVAAAAQNRFVSELSQAIAEAVQKYINDNVRTRSANGPDPHEHDMQAP